MMSVETNHKESGMVLVTVLIMVLIIMMISVTILSQSMNQNKYSKGEVERIQAEQLAKGVFWNRYATNSFVNGSYSLGRVGTKNYYVNIIPTGAGPGSTQGYIFNVYY